MDEATNKTTDEIRNANKSFVFCLLANFCLFICFCSWAAVEPHINPLMADKIDELLIPWGWLVGFFFVSILTLKEVGSQTRELFASIAISIIFAAFLFFAWATVLMPMFGTGY
jgi:hypothetical protein